MGRLFVQYLAEEESTPQTKFVCANCTCEVADEGSVVWEGYMGAQKPAYLFRSVINADPCSVQREETLSSGGYTLVDVQCRGCTTTLGWQYVTAKSQDHKYKEGTTLLQQALLRRCAPTAQGSSVSQPGATLAALHLASFGQTNDSAEATDAHVGSGNDLDSQHGVMRGLQRLLHAPLEDRLQQNFAAFAAAAAAGSPEADEEATDQLQQLQQLRSFMDTAMLPPQHAQLSSLPRTANSQQVQSAVLHTTGTAFRQHAPTAANMPLPALTQQREHHEDVNRRRQLARRRPLYASSMHQPEEYMEEDGMMELPVPARC